MVAPVPQEAPVGLMDDIAKSVSDNKDKVTDALADNQDKIEGGIDKVAEKAKDVVPDQHGDKVDSAADALKKGLDKLT